MKTAINPRVYHWMLLSILCLGLFLRVYKINTLPAGLHRDEASVGYNAYLLFHTFRDEHGKFLPLVFEAFGDWKRPINIYLSALLIPITGMSVATVRLPVALFGWVTILLMYLIVVHISKNKIIGLLSAFILAISPWHIYMSRTGLGWNVVGLTVFLLACYWLLLGKKSRTYTFLSGGAFGLSLFTYASNQFITPLFITFFALWQVIQTKKISVKWEFTFPFLMLFILFISIYLPVMRENSIGSSFFTENFKYHSVEIPYSEHDTINEARIFHNKMSGWVEKYAQNYLQLFSPQFLLYNSADNPSYSLKNFGNIHFFEIVFVVVGAYALLRYKFPYYLFILALVFITPIPAALTQSPTSSTRSLMWVPVLSLFIALGIYHLYIFLKAKKVLYGYIFFGLLMVYYGASLLKLSDEYLTHFPVNRGEHWGYAQKQLVDYLATNAQNYDEVLISRPHETFYIYLMYYSFFDKYTPSQIEHYPKSADGFVYAKSLDKYSFREIEYLEDLRVPNRLIIDKTLDMHELATPSSYLSSVDDPRGSLYTEVKVEETIRLVDGTPVYSILSTSKLKTIEELGKL